MFRFSDSTLTVMCDVTNAIWVAKLDSKTDELRGDRLLVLQNRLLMQAMGADDEAVESSRRMHRALWDVVLDESLTADESVVHIRSIIESDPEFAAAPEEERAAGMKQALSQLTSPWIRAFA
jgi:hypothetical protein